MPDPQHDAREHADVAALLLARGPKVINLGLEAFAADLAGQGIPVTQVDWVPPAGGDPRLASILAKLTR